MVVSAKRAKKRKNFVKAKNMGDLLREYVKALKHEKLIALFQNDWKQVKGDWNSTTGLVVGDAIIGLKSACFRPNKYVLKMQYNGVDQETFFFESETEPENVQKVRVLKERFGIEN